MTQPFYDVFISHAYEDQNEFAGKLAIELKRRGLKVWYSGFELKMGSSITASVNKALRESRYGVVIISPVYLNKAWAMKELESLFALEVESARILPVLHGMSVETFRSQLPLLSDRFSVSSRTGVRHVADRVAQAIKGGKVRSGRSVSVKTMKKRRKKKSGTAAANITNAGVIVLGGKADVVNAAGGNITIRKSKK